MCSRNSVWGEAVARHSNLGFWGIKLWKASDQLLSCPLKPAAHWFEACTACNCQDRCTATESTAPMLSSSSELRRTVDRRDSVDARVGSTVAILTLLEG